MKKIVGMQQIQRSGKAAALLATGLLAVACVSLPLEDAALRGERASLGAESKREAPVSLAPGPAGTPLPPRNPEAARNWPPEFRHFVDASLELFKPGTTEPSLQDFEAKLGIKLLPSNWKKLDGDGRLQVHRVEAPWIYRFKPTDPPYWEEQSTLTELQRPFTSSPDAGLRTYMLSFVMAKDMADCINPYDLAIYTGANFTNSDISPHQASRPVWSDAYEWGMFMRGHSGRYISSKGFGIGVNASNSSRPVQHDATCITSLWFIGRFQPGSNSP